MMSSPKVHDVDADIAGCEQAARAFAHEVELPVPVDVATLAILAAQAARLEGDLAEALDVMRNVYRWLHSALSTTDQEARDRLLGRAWLAVSEVAGQ